MIGCLRTRVRKQPIIALYFVSEDDLKFFNLEGWYLDNKTFFMLNSAEHEVYLADKYLNANNCFNIYQHELLA